jgi:hypothetical protein
MLPTTDGPPRDSKGPTDVAYLIRSASFEQREPGMFDAPQQ